MNGQLRHEIKFVLDEYKYLSVMSWIYSHTTLKRKFNDRVVNSIYFDDEKFSSAADNLIGISKRSKYRYRWYESNFNSGILEKKIKINKLGFKEYLKVELPFESSEKISYYELNCHIKKALHANDIFHERPFFPALDIQYTRSYFENSEGVRLTLDDKIFFYDTAYYSNIRRSMPIRNYSYILELKFTEDKFNYVSNMISQLSLVPRRNSKYLTGLASFSKAVYI